MRVAHAAPLRTDLIDGVAAQSAGVGVGALPDVGMKSGALLDGEGRVIWARRPLDKRAMASITKIMTAVVALEHSSLTEQVTIPKASVAVGESTAFLRPGEKLSMQEVLEALLVKSGNDAAIAIAQHVAGNEDEFVKLMNEKATELGLTNTHFANAHGLDEKGHYSTAYDLGVLARYAMTKPAFKQIVGMKTVVIGSGKRKETLQSTDLLLGNYTGAMGIKTGYTADAGYSVISAAQRGGVTLYAVVLGTPSELQRFREARELFDWGFSHYRPMQLGVGGTVVGEAAVGDYLDVTVPAAVSQDTTVPVLDVKGPIVRSVTVATVRAPVKKGDRVGTVTFKQAGRIITSIPLVSTEDVGKPNIFERVWIAIVRGWRRVFANAPAPAATALS